MSTFQQDLKYAIGTLAHSCLLSRCNGTGEVYETNGLVSACECPIGQQLSPKVVALFDQMNAFRKACGDSADAKSRDGSV